MFHSFSGFVHAGGARDPSIVRARLYVHLRRPGGEGRGGVHGPEDQAPGGEVSSSFVSEGIFYDHFRFLAKIANSPKACGVILSTD